MKPSDTLAAVVPYAVWMVLMFALPGTAASYAIRSACALVALAVFLPKDGGRVARPFFSGRAWASLAWGLAAGLLVTVLWIAPESIPAYRDFSLVGFLGLGGGAAAGASPYDPAVCGWPLTAVRLAGSAFVIAAVEELFFRSFLYRWLQKSDWTKVDPGKFDLSAFLWMIGLFSLEHHTRLAAGAMAGAVYGFVAIRRGIGSAIVAHMTTNFALGVWVVATRDWNFW
ncbi:MAG: CAAX prenyl protease-related protein [Kiritimatiellae bacterium]|nr:CAAX prenyl protease-related protein [Kiritimatiellia bacterium]